MEISKKTQDSIIALVSNLSYYSEQDLIDAILLRIECELLYQKMQDLEKDRSQILFELEKSETILSVKDK